MVDEEQNTFYLKRIKALEKLIEKTCSNESCIGLSEYRCRILKKNTEIQGGKSLCQLDRLRIKRNGLVILDT